MRLYQSANFADRLIILARLIFSASPIIDILEQYLPKDGLIVDLGCGYGVISHLLSFSYPQRKIIGFDVSQTRIESAKKSISNNIQFQLADIRDAQIPACDAVIIIDILYLLPYQDQEKVLIKCFEKLNQNGILIIKDTDKSAIWKFRYTYIEEKIKIKLSLYGKEVKKSSLYYQTSEDFIILLKRIGFDVSTIHKKQILYPGIFYICQKT
ncbi:TPA: class I SAM-dependent methyltransferase [bacterium]|nr:class I SAM-dependent methyltransferase [bacterium]